MGRIHPTGGRRSAERGPKGGLLKPISITDALGKLSGPWQPADVATVNESVVRIARLLGEFPWHHHDEDELFLCWDGAFRIELDSGDRIELKAGDVFVVPRGIEHRPVAEQEAHAVLLERSETKQYGD